MRAIASIPLGAACFYAWAKGMDTCEAQVRCCLEPEDMAVERSTVLCIDRIARILAPIILYELFPTTHSKTCVC
jgi:hypothetical protein